MTTKIQKVLLTGKSHTTLRKSHAAAGGEPNVAIHLSSPNAPQALHSFDDVKPHPTAEQLFAGAWSACYITALGLMAKQHKLDLPEDTAVNVEVDLGSTGEAYLLQARLNVFLPGFAAELAELLAHSAHEICPYSKAARGNIDISLNVMTP